MTHSLPNFANKILIIVKLLLIVQSNCFNIFPDSNIITTDEITISESYFGFSVQLRSNPDGNLGSVIVGAPRANSTFENHQQLVQPGAIFKCDVGTTFCTQYLLYRDGNTNYTDDKNTNMHYHEHKDNGWLGATIDGSDLITGPIMTCAPRWVNTIKGANWDMPGFCYLLENGIGTHQYAKNVFPLQDGYKRHIAINGISTFYYSFGQTGFSLNYMQNPVPLYLLGAPGILTDKGMVTKYSSSSSLIPNPDSVKDIKSNSMYFGYSVAFGTFTNSGKIWYVAGAPRGAQLRGQIFVYEYKVDTIVIRYQAHGFLLGEYFGSTVSVADVNKDGYDDILVGAPMNFKQGEDIGVVYIFLSNGKGSFAKANFDLGPTDRDAKWKGARFGTAISNIGDINSDGYTDVAVGAPYYDGGRGAVFIYAGSRDGLKRSPYQVIMASEVSEPLRAFGASLSKGLDIDNNRINDVAVGAYKSGHVIILKSRPIVIANGNITSSPESFGIATESINLKICLGYTGSYLPPTIDFQYWINFTDSRITLSRTGNDNVAVKRINVDRSTGTCRDIRLNIQNDAPDSIDPVTIRLSYTLDKADVACGECPILDTNRQNFVAKDIPYNHGCGNDAVCTPDLKISARYDHDGSNFIIGSTDKLDIIVDVENSAEPAFLSHLDVEVPSSVSFYKKEHTCRRTNHGLDCMLVDVISKENQISLIFGLDISKLTNENELRVVLSLSSSGNDLNPEDNVKILELPLMKKFSLKTKGVSEPSNIQADQNTKNLSFVHRINVINEGPSALDQLRIRFSVPYKLRDTVVLQVQQPKATFARQSTISKVQLECKTSKGLDFVADPVNFGSGDREPGDTIAKRSTENEEGQGGDFETNELVLNRAIIYDAHSELEPSSTTQFDCDSGGLDIGCVDIECTSPEAMRKYDRMSVQMQMIADILAIGDIDSSKTVLVISTKSTIFADHVTMPIQEGRVQTIVYSYAAIQSATLTAVLIGIGSGVIVLIIIILIMWKCGLFKRKNYKELIHNNQDVGGPSNAPTEKSDLFEYNKELEPVLDPNPTT